MRSLFYPVLFLIIAVVFGLVWLLFRPPWMTQVPSTIAAIVGKEKPRQTEPKPSPIVEVKKEPAKRKPVPQEIAMASRTETIARPADSAPALPRRFPLAAGISNGTARSAVLANFGQPDASAIGSDIGQLRERYIYVDRATGRKTFISLVNGNVIAAETLPQ